MTRLAQTADLASLLMGRCRGKRKITKCAGLAPMEPKATLSPVVTCEIPVNARSNDDPRQFDNLYCSPGSQPLHAFDVLKPQLHYAFRWRRSREAGNGARPGADAAHRCADECARWQEPRMVTRSGCGFGSTRTSSIVGTGPDALLPREIGSACRSLDRAILE
jgi:hypothetical protein